MIKLGGQPCGSPDPWYLGKTKASVSCRAASLGQEPTGTLTCVGTGANKRLGGRVSARARSGPRRTGAKTKAESKTTLSPFAQARRL
ncbi:hypothetical protein GMOD_00005516 [Pyrenophora seminiperda CCB06]|uniref:Uncharacterized protein n=1 Tax=Pyrenophora seminiperda CCB06 TaxID=1302712 RepID=A0A3M7M990_9PLEO|nr:hypothetical protein GMOD_00005516 [Pyrenophora seminiperda CCB06]